jgi:hypothetical protein
MNTSDECDCVVKGSFTVSDLSSLNLEILGDVLTKSLVGAPLENVRPMTVEEVNEFLEDEGDGSFETVGVL